MKNKIIILLIIIASFFSCKDDKTIIAETKIKIFSNLYTEKNIKSNFFKINAKKDTILFSENGTLLRIYANSFISKKRDKLNEIKIEIKEVFNPINFILGNLTTTSNNELLSSGGMIYLNASTEKEKLTLRKGREIGIIIPTEKFDEKMLIFQGIKDSTSINWINQDSILNKKLIKLEQSYKTITFQYDNFLGYLKDTLTFKKWIWKSDRKIGDKIRILSSNITIIDISRDTVSLNESKNGLFIPEVITKKGQNGFVEDFNTSYIFSIKKLGWANIDKFFSDPKSKNIDLIVNANNKKFKYIFTSLLLPNRNMYIPGYERKDGTFGFTHNDLEELILPIGEKAYIMATSYIDENPYFELKEFEISKKKTIFLDLVKTTPNELKTKLSDKIK